MRRDLAIAGVAGCALVLSALEIRRLRSLLAASVKALPLSEARVPGTALLAGVELGGTTCRVAIAYADSPTKIFSSVEIPTLEPEATIPSILNCLDQHAPFVALGIASFGPLDLNPSSETYGFITTTPKLKWQNFNLLAPFRKYNVPIGFDTDVNAPALAERKYGSYGADCSDLAYITVGTGVGVGLVVNNGPVHGLVHPEGGHIMALRRSGDRYEGWSPIHRESIESMASARACADRIGVQPSELSSVSNEHPAWDDIAYYLAQLCVTITYLVSPHVIVFSGGVMKRRILFTHIRRHFLRLNHHYISARKVVHDIENYIVPSQFGDEIGIIGAIELARRAAARTPHPAHPTPPTSPRS